MYKSSGKNNSNGRMAASTGNAALGNSISKQITAFDENTTNDKTSGDCKPKTKTSDNNVTAIGIHHAHSRRVRPQGQSALQKVEERLVCTFQEKTRARQPTAATAANGNDVPTQQQQQQQQKCSSRQGKYKKKSDKMVLPFGLGPDGNNLDAIQNAEVAPSAPPARFAVPPPYPRGQTNIYTGVPIILNPYIDFIVVNGDDRYMIRCERKFVLERSVELAKLIHAGPNSGRKSDNHYQISNVDKNDFELIIRYMETRFIRYRDHKHLLKILELADRFNVPDLIIYCIRELDLNITSATVLDIFKALWFYQNIALTNQHQTVITTQNASDAAAKKAAKASRAAAKAANNNATTTATTNTTTSTASTASVNGNAANNSNENECAAQPIPNPNPFTTEDYGVALLHNALQLIDMHAELVLSKREMCDLRFEELETIVKRETLQLSSEVTLFDCLADWSWAECRRKNLDATAENRRRVLGPLCLMPRYLRMSTNEFRKCCERIELLHPTEASLVNDALEGKKLKNLTNQQNELLEKFRTPRSEYAKMPVHLSDRSHPQNYPKKMRLSQEGRSTEEGCWEKVGMNCLRVFACIFD